MNPHSIHNFHGIERSLRASYKLHRMISRILSLLAMPNFIVAYIVWKHSPGDTAGSFPLIACAVGFGCVIGSYVAHRTARHAEDLHETYFPSLSIK